MAWTVNRKWIYPPNWDENAPLANNRGGRGSRHYIVQLTGESDGSDEESAVKKITLADLIMQNGQVPTRSSIEIIRYDTKGLNFIRLEWDRDSNREIAPIPGETIGEISGPLVDNNPGDNNGEGNTGDILLTTDGTADGAVYNIQLTIKPKNTSPVTASTDPA